MFPLAGQPNHRGQTRATSLIQRQEVGSCGYFSHHKADLPARHRLGKMLNRAAEDDAAGWKADRSSYVRYGDQCV